MTEEKKNEENILTDEELNKVSGGTVIKRVPESDGVRRIPMNQTADLETDIPTEGGSLFR